MGKAKPGMHSPARLSFLNTMIFTSKTNYTTLICFLPYRRYFAKPSIPFLNNLR